MEGLRFEKNDIRYRKIISDISELDGFYNDQPLPFTC